MIQYKRGICENCGKERYIVNRRHYLCQECNHDRLHGRDVKGKPIKKRRYNEKFPYSTAWGFTSEKEMFKHIWDTRPHKSELSGIKIPEPKAHNFLHVLPKGLNKYPHFRFNPYNIVLGTMKEHHLFDNGTDRQRREYEKSVGMEFWDSLYEMAERFKREYKDEFETDEAQYIEEFE